MKTENIFVWVDLEMTGLCPEKDHILEIACLITDSSLNVLEQGLSFIIVQSDKILENMSPAIRCLHEESGLMQKIRNGISIKNAESQLISFLKPYSNMGAFFLCGNSIWVDRMFLRVYMPELMNLFHYRMVDVSTIKELVQRWYPDHIDLPFKKKKSHRALDDIRESIAELDFYKNNFFIHQ